MVPFSFPKISSIYNRYSSGPSNTNNYGYRLMELCRSFDIHTYIVNCRFGADSHFGRQTCKNCNIVKKVNGRLKFLYRLSSFLEEKLKKYICLALIQCQLDMNVHPGTPVRTNTLLA